MSVAPLVTPRLILRTLRESDVDAILAIRTDPLVIDYTSIRGYTRERARALVDEMRDGAPGVPGSWFQFGVERRDTGAFVGEVGLRCENSAKAPDTFEIGFTLAAAHHRQGFGAEAVRAALAFAFGPLGAHRVFGNCDTRNIASAALMAKVGMRREAHHVDDWWHLDLDGNGEWTSSFIYAALAREWDQPGR